MFHWDQGHIIGTLLHLCNAGLADLQLGNFCESMRTTFFITGAGGFIGRHLTARLIADGHTVLGVDDLSASGSRLTEGVAEARVELLSVDALKGVDTVIHLAAAKRVDASFVDLTPVGRNLHADLHLFQTAFDANVRRLIFASSCEVYGDSPRIPNSERARPRPASPYACAKFASEQVLNSISSMHPSTSVSILRLFNVYGEDEATTALIPKFVERLRDGSVLRVEGDGNQRRDFNYIDDTAEMIVKLALAEEMPRLINLGSGISTSVNEIVKMLSTNHAKPVRVEHVAARPHEIPEFRSDADLWSRSFGAGPVRPVSEGLAMCQAASLVN